VGNILHKNLMLLFKWWWRFSKCDNSLWKRILISIYNIKGLHASSHTFQGIKSGTWAQLLSDDVDTSKIRSIVEEGLQINIGDGNSTLFWYDKWYHEGPLKGLFPRLFSISMQQNALIAQMGSWLDNEWTWNLSWRRQLFEWEREEVERLNLIMAQITPRHGTNDDVVWRGGSFNVFPIKEISDSLYSSITPILPKEISHIIWKIKAPPRALLVIWLANLEKLKTGDTLIDRGLLEPRLGVCPFCDNSVESNSHILFSCRFSWRIWMEILHW
jgi:reverse transcriptase-like protein